QYEEFVSENSNWLEDYALFSALKEHFSDACWQDWPEDIRLREADAVARYKDLLRDKRRYYKFVQYVFYTQWEDMRKKLSDADIRLIGDIPIYVAYDSADVWSNPKQFQLNEQRRPTW